MTDLEEFLKERDRLLLEGDPDKCVAFILTGNPDIEPPTSWEMAELLMHKAITSRKSLPMDYRVKSYIWLVSRGCRSLDDGDVKAAAEGK